MVDLRRTRIRNDMTHIQTTLRKVLAVSEADDFTTDQQERLINMPGGLRPFIDALTYS